MNKQIVSGVFCFASFGIGCFISRKIYFADESLVLKQFNSNSNGFKTFKESNIQIPNWFWIGFLMPIWGLSIWIICEKIYFRKADIVTRCIDSVLNLLKDKNITNWFKSQFQNDKISKPVTHFKKKSQKHVNQYFDDSE